MSKFRRIISVFLTFCLLLSLFPAQVIAVDETPAVPQAVTDVTETDVVATGHVSTGVQYNPLYDVPSVSGSSQKYYSGTGAVSVEDADYLTSAQEAAAVLRAGMVQRTADIPVYYRVDAAQCDGSEAAVIAIANEVFELALAHTGISTEGDALRWAYESFSSDISYSATGEYYYFGFTFHMTYYTTAEQEAVLTAQVDQVLSGFAFDENTDDYTKIKTIYDYICDNVVYDYDNLNDASHKLKFTAYAALMNGTSVCQGYALLLYRMLLDVGVDCRVITGIGGGDNHAWNIIAVDGAYYNADSTWDAGTTQYGYFLTCDANFPDHTREDSYTTETFHAAYPMGAADYAQSVELTDQIQGNFVYSVSLGQATLTQYTGNETDVVVPAQLGGYPVVRIAQTAFYCNMDIQTLSFSEGICYMDGEAVYGCHSLRKITFPSTMYLTFEDPEGNVFSGCGAPVVSCPALAEVVVAEGNPNIVVYDGALYSADMKLLLLLPAANPREEFRVPDGVVGISSDSCRDNTNLKRVILPDTVKTIGYWAFDGSANLEQINIPESCTFIGQYAFKNTAIKSLHIPASTTIIVGGAFGTGCRPETITVDENNPVYYAVDNALYARGENGDSLIKYAAGSGKTEFSVPAGVVSIDWYAFADADNLQRVNLPTGLTAIGNSAFYNCSALTSITFSGDAPTIDESAFSNVVATVYYPYGNDTWNDDTMLQYGGALTWVEQDPPAVASGTCGDNLTWALMADGTLTISGEGDMTSSPWRDYSELIQTVVIGEGVTSIGEYAFSNCSSLTAITFNGNAPTINADAFRYVTATVYYPYANDTWNANTMLQYGGTLTWAASIASGTCGDQLTWALMADGTLIVSGKGKMGTISSYIDVPWHDYAAIIKRVVIGEGVTSIGNYAFYDCSSLTTVELPDTLTSIGKFAFSDCSSLTEVVIPEGVTSIGAWVFYDCSSLTAVELPDTLTSIGNFAFYRCFALTAVELPDTLTSIGGEAFSNCSSLTEITIPEGVTAIGEYAFSDCSSLTSITFSGNAPTINADAFRYVTATVYYPYDNNTWIDAFMQNYGGTLTWVKQDPPIASGTCGDDLTWVLTQDGTLTISGTGEMYYYSNGSAPWYSHRVSIQTVVIEEGVTSIGSSAFYYCIKLTSVEIPESVTSIRSSAFYGCSSLTVVDIPDSVTSMGGSVFYDCIKLTSVELPDFLPSIESYTFYNCSSLTAVELPNTLTYLKQRAFYGCSSLTAINIPDCVLTIDYYTFYGCTKLASAKLPASLLSIGSEAFRGCSSLTEIAIPAGVTSINSFTFTDCSSLTMVVIPEDVTSIGKFAFSGCSSLTEIVIPESVTSIGESAFQRCSSLTAVVIPNGIISINDGAFSACSSLTEIVIPEGVTSIGQAAFSDCSSLTAVELPDTLISIDSYAFRDCSSLTAITFNGDAPTINESIFSGVTATVYYPAGNDTWNESTMLQYDGTLTWKARCLDHVAVTDPAVAPTCTETGLTEGSHCSVCGEILVAQEVVDALGHTWTSAAAVQPGFEQKVCTGCAGVMRIPLSGWVHLDGTWYHCTQPGVVDTGWHFVDGQLHYFSTNGAAATGWQQIDGARYYFDSLGALVAPDPRYAGVTQFYPDDSGEMVPGWKQLDDTWYYFNESGCMVPGWREIRGTLYYYTDSGAWMPSWKEIGGTWYYYSRSDTAEPYWQIIGGFWDYPLSSGVNS